MTWPGDNFQFLSAGQQTVNNLVIRSPEFRSDENPKTRDEWPEICVTFANGNRKLRRRHSDFPSQDPRFTIHYPRSTANWKPMRWHRRPVPIHPWSSAMCSLSFGTGIHKTAIYDMSLSVCLCNCRFWKGTFILMYFVTCVRAFGLSSFRFFSVVHGLHSRSLSIISSWCLARHLIYLRFSAHWAFGFEINFFDCGEKKPLCGSIFIVPPAAFAMCWNPF